MLHPAVAVATAALALLHPEAAYGVGQPFFRSCQGSVKAGYTVGQKASELTCCCCSAVSATWVAAEAEDLTCCKLFCLAFRWRASAWSRRFCW